MVHLDHFHTNFSWFFSGSSGAYYLPDVDMRLTSKLPMQYRSVVPSTTSPLPAMVGSADHLVSNMYTVNEVIRKR